MKVKKGQEQKVPVQTAGVEDQQAVILIPQEAAEAGAAMEELALTVTVDPETVS